MTSAPKQRRRPKPPKKKEVMGPPPPSMAVLAPEILDVLRKINRFLTDYDKRYNYESDINLDSNAAITADYRQLKVLRAEFCAAATLSDKLEQTAHVLGEYVSNFECRVNAAAEVVEVTPSGIGIAIEKEDNHWELGCRSGQRVTISGVGEDGRSAVISRMSARGTKYRLTLRNPSKGFHPGNGRSYGDDWRYEVAMAEGRFWVVGGVRPPELNGDEE